MDCGGPSANYNHESWKLARYQDWRSNAAVCAANYMGSTAQNELLILPEITMQQHAAELRLRRQLYPALRR